MIIEIVGVEDVLVVWMENWISYTFFDFVKVEEEDIEVKFEVSLGCVMIFKEVVFILLYVKGKVRILIK